MLVVLSVLRHEKKRKFSTKPLFAWEKLGKKCLKTPTVNLKRLKLAQIIGTIGTLSLTGSVLDFLSAVQVFRLLVQKCLIS